MPLNAHVRNQCCSVFRKRTAAQFNFVFVCKGRKEEHEEEMEEKEVNSQESVGKFRGGIGHGNQGLCVLWLTSLDLWFEVEFCQNSM